MKKVVIFLILFQVFSSYAQINTDNISFELRYPFPIGNNFINKAQDLGYTGLFDLGLDYNILNTFGIGVGVLFNASFLQLSQTDVNLMILSPKVKVEYEINLNKISIIPQIGVGYSNWRFQSPGVTLTGESGNAYRLSGHIQNYNGLSIKSITKFILNNDKRVKWYLNFSHEFTKLEKPEEPVENRNYNRNIHLIYPGIGMKWSFKDEG
jgi:hypothetical protein